MDLDIVKALQSLQNPIFDWFFYVVTQIGDQYVFIVIASILYWTINKKYAHKFVMAYLGSAIINVGLKAIFQRPRPFNHEGVYEPDIPGVRTSGTSFPSGHAHAAGVIAHSLYDVYKQTNRKIYYYLGLFVVIFVPLSRVYLGQHFLSDVIVGAVLGFMIAFLMFKLVVLMKDKEHIYTLYVIPIFILLLFFFKDENLYIAAGGFSGFAIGYALEKMYVNFSVENSNWIQVLKIAIGLTGAILFKEGLKLFFPDTLFFDFIRYFMIGVWAAVGAPWVFKHAFRNR
ncbi:MAG: phosphatase PAP2 family protein [Acholeplasmataceae bacterium]|nr:phosphatase PAP2 family protein [Acholeplasmataceae bacterium]